MTLMDSPSAAPRVAIVGDDDPTFVEDLRTTLQASGIRSRVLTVPTLEALTRAPNLTLILGNAVHDGGVGVVDRVGEDRGPFAVVLGAGSLSVRLEARTRGLSVIPRPKDGAALGRDVERLIDSSGAATDVTRGAPRMAMNPGAPVEDLDWEDESETIQHVEAEVTSPDAPPPREERESLPEIGSGPSGLGRTFPRREVGYRTTLQGLSPGGQDVTVAASESTTEALRERSTKPEEERATEPVDERGTLPESRRSTKPAPRSTRPERPSQRTKADQRPEPKPRPDGRRHRATVRPGRRQALPETETRMVAHPTAPLEAEMRGQQTPPPSETRVVPDPTGPLYQEPTRHAASDYSKRLAEAVEDPDATAPHRPAKKPTRSPTSRPSERPAVRDARAPSDLPPRAAPKRPSTPPRTSQPPPRGVQALAEPPAESAAPPARPDTANLAAPGRAAPPTAPTAPSAPPIPLLPKPPRAVEAGYSKPPPPARPPARPPRAAEEESETGAPIPLLSKPTSAPRRPAAPAATPVATATATPPTRSAWPWAVAALVVVAGLGGAAWVLVPSATPAGPTAPAETTPAETAPAETAPADHSPADPAPDTAQTEEHPDVGVPAETRPAEPGQAEPTTEAEPAEGPVDVRAEMREGRRHLRGRRWSEARAAFTRVLSQGEDPDAHEGLAQVALAEENAEQALEHAEAAVGLRRTRARYHRLLGDARRLGGDDLGARRAYERAVSLDPEDEAAERLEEL